MKKYVFLWLVFPALLTWSCNSDPCANADCGNGSCIEIADEAVCRCGVGSGYELDDEDRCTVVSAERFTGTWQVTELRTNNETFITDTIDYEVMITNDDVTIARIFISNLGGLDQSFCNPQGPVNVIASVNIRNVEVSEATYCPSPNDNFSGYRIGAVAGTDTISSQGDLIKLAYNLSFTDANGANDFDCDVTMTR